MNQIAEQCTNVQVGNGYKTNTIQVMKKSTAIPLLAPAPSPSYHNFPTFLTSVVIFSLQFYRFNMQSRHYHLVLPGFELSGNRSIQYVLFYVWFLLVNTIFMRINYIIACSYSLLIFHCPMVSHFVTITHLSIPLMNF